MAKGGTPLSPKSGAGPPMPWTLPFHSGLRGSGRWAPSKTANLMLDEPQLSTTTSSRAGGDRGRGGGGGGGATGGRERGGPPPPAEGGGGPADALDLAVPQRLARQRALGTVEDGELDAGRAAVEHHDQFAGGGGCGVGRDHGGEFR